MKSILLTIISCIITLPCFGDDGASYPKSLPYSEQFDTHVEKNKAWIKGIKERYIKGDIAKKTSNKWIRKGRGAITDALEGRATLDANLDSWYLGAEAPEANDKSDLAEMLAHYQDCGELEPESLCIICPGNRSLLGPNGIRPDVYEKLYEKFKSEPTLIRPGYHYYMPVHKIEISEQPGKTGYARKELIKANMFVDPTGQKDGKWTKAKYGNDFGKLVSQPGVAGIIQILSNEYKKISEQSLRTLTTGEPWVQKIPQNDFGSVGFFSGINFNSSKQDLGAIEKSILAARRKNSQYTWTTSKLPAASWVFPHVFDAKFHDTYKTNIRFQPYWGHDGAVLAQRNIAVDGVLNRCPPDHICKAQPITVKRSVPQWFAEGSSNDSVQVFFNPVAGYDAISPISKKAKITILATGGNLKTLTTGGEKIMGKQDKGARAANYMSSGRKGKTPIDIWKKAKRNQLSLEDKIPQCNLKYTQDGTTESKCLLGEHGEKLPLTAWVGTLYHPRAAMIAAWRGIFWVNTFEDDGKISDPYKSSLDDNCSPRITNKRQYHPFVNKTYSHATGGERPRARLQILTNHTGNRYKEFAGCQKFKNQEEFFPDLAALEYKQAIQSYPDDEGHGNHTVIVQWQYFRNCVTYYEDIFDSSGFGGGPLSQIPSGPDPLLHKGIYY